MCISEVGYIGFCIFSWEMVGKKKIFKEGFLIGMMCVLGGWF